MEIDVSKCRLSNGSGDCISPINKSHTKCEKVPIDWCYFKQLSRAKEENEKLKYQNEILNKKLEPKLKNAHCVYFEGQTGLCRAKEFVKCNPVNCELYTIDELSTILDLQNKLQAKEQECEELKKEKAEIKKYLGISDEPILQRLEDPQEFKDELKISEYNYKHALDEIEEYCEKILSDLLHYSQGTVNTAEKIRNIINKTKENK